MSVADLDITGRPRRSVLPLGDFHASMQFTPREMKLIEQLRKQERRRPWTRWLLLGMASFIFAAHGYLYHLLVSTLGSDAFALSDSVFVAIFWPLDIQLLAVACAFIVLAIRGWHGNVHRMLLLRLLDDCQKDTSNDAKVA